MFLFNGTIEDNIRYGRPGATLEEAVAATRMANAHKFILQRADGYDSLWALAEIVYRAVRDSASR